MTTSSFLREAADRLEELAEKATPGPWDAVLQARPPQVNRLWRGTFAENVASTNGEGNAHLIATFGNPQVARAVAAAMRSAAERHQPVNTSADGVRCQACWRSLATPNSTCRDIKGWLAVAAAVLARPAPDRGGSE